MGEGRQHDKGKAAKKIDAVIMSVSLGIGSDICSDIRTHQPKIGENQSCIGRHQYVTT